MNTEHPITPPPELVTSLRNSAPHGLRDAGVTRELCLINNAYAAGANQELEACCGEMKSLPSPLGIPFGEMASNALRAARRPSPKPPSLKERALHELAAVYNRDEIDNSAYDTIRRALEALPNE